MKRILRTVTDLQAVHIHPYNLLPLKVHLLVRLSLYSVLNIVIFGKVVYRGEIHDPLLC